MSHLSNAAAFEAFVNKVAWENWYCYVKEPFAGPAEVVKYIGRYTHRIAISNYRILDISAGQVTFRYKKYHDGTATQETMSLRSDEFIRRFLVHVIPLGFKRIRHFGFLSCGLKTRALELARTLFNQVQEKVQEAESTFLKWLENIERPCPECKKGVLKLIDSIPAWRWGYG